MVQRFYRLAWVLLLVVTSCWSQQDSKPVLFAGGVLNAASFSPSALPGGAIARGSIFSIFGRNIGPAQPVQVSQFPLPQQLGGVSIELTQGTTKQQLLPLFVSANQINALLLSNAPLGQVQITVSYTPSGGQAQTSNPASFEVVAHAPGIFTATGSGMGWGILQNFKSQTDQPINQAVESIKPGQAGTLWLTGLGAVTGGDQNSPPVGDLPYDIEVWVGGRKVSRILYKGRAPGISGLDQIVFFVPDDTPEGCFVPVFVVSNGAVSNSTTIAVNRNGGACQDLHNPVATRMVGGGKVLMGMLARFSGPFGNPPASGTLDKGLARAVQFAPSGFAFDPLFSLPPLGTCTAYSFRGNLLVNDLAPAPAAKVLDLGAVSASSGSKEEALPVSQPTTGVREKILSGPQPPSFFGGDKGGLKAAGGPDGSAVNAEVTLPGEFQGSNFNSISTLNPANPPTLTWPAKEGQAIFALALVYDKQAEATAGFLCLSQPGAGSLPIPAYILRKLPAPKALFTDRQAVFMAGAFPNLTQSTGRADALNVFLGGLQFRMKSIIEVKQ